MHSTYVRTFTVREHYGKKQNKYKVTCFLTIKKKKIGLGCNSMHRPDRPADKVVTQGERAWTREVESKWREKNFKLW